VIVGALGPKVTKVMPIQVDTREEHRMKGFALATCAAFIEFCLEEGLQPRWECDVSNVASASLARKLGFALDRELTVFRLHW
jgi:RimJ/RimL family protein N-acetyltransferase